MDEYVAGLQTWIRTGQFFINEELPVKCSKISIEAREKGNKLYAIKNHDYFSHSQNFIYYSKSIASAPNDSQELALAYSNRSALLLHLKRYEECLIDIEKAYRITRSEELRNKLSSRKIKCLALLESKKNSQQSDLDEAEILKFIPSKRIPCAAESVGLKYNKKYGRHLVANRDIKPGEIIIKEKCYITFPALSSKYFTCNHCLTYAWNGIPCDTCAGVIYCGDKCKQEAWQEYHDIECSILSFFYSINSKEPMCMDIQIKAAAVRLFIKAIKKEGFDVIKSDVNLIDNSSDMQLNGFFEDDIFQSNKFRSFYNLLSRKEFSSSVEQKTKATLSKIRDLLFKSNDFNKLMDFNNSNDIKKSKTLVEKLFMKFEKIIVLNNFMDRQLRTGIAVAPCHSLVNHNCYPNSATILTKDCEIVLYAVRPIKKSKQISVNYISFDTPRESRQEYLQNRYNFTCRCQPCKEFWPSKIENPPQTYEEIFNSLVEITSSVGLISREQLYSYLDDPVQTWPHDKKTLAKMKKILILISKHLTGYKALLANRFFSNYIQLIFDDFSESESKMPDNC